MCANVRENTRCEGVLFTPRRLQWIAVNCERNQLKQKKKEIEQQKKLWELASNSIRMRTTTKNF